MRFILVLAFSLAAAALASCASHPDSGSPPPSSTQGTTLVQTGYVTDVRDVIVHDIGQRPAIGATVGALLGGIAGSNIGGGLGRAAATVAGATVGGIAGQHIGKSNGGTSLSKLTVRFENGDIRTYDIEPDEVFRVGEQVKIITNASKVRISH